MQQEPSILPPPGPISIREPSSKARAIPEGEYARAFQLIDTNGDEELSKVEIMFACVKHEEVRELLGVTKENAQQALNSIWKQADADASGAITFDEFEPFVDLLRGSSSSVAAPPASAPGPSGRSSAASSSAASEGPGFDDRAFSSKALLTTQKSWKAAPEELQEKSVRV